MNFVKVIAIGALGFAAYTYYAGYKQSDEEIISQTDWHEIESKAHKFKASFPAPVEQKEQSANIPKVGIVKIAAYQTPENAKSQCVIVAMSHLDKSSYNEDIEDIVSQEKQKLKKKLGGLLKDERVLMHQGIKGYELILDGKNKRQVKARMFINKNHLYNLMCSYQPNDATEVKANHFIDSFMML